MLPIDIELAVAPLNADQVVISATITSTVMLNDVAFGLELEPDVQVVASSLPSSLQLAAQETQTFEVTLRSTSSAMRRVDLVATATFNDMVISDRAIVFLAVRESGLVRVPDAEALRALEEAQRKQLPPEQQELELDWTIGPMDGTTPLLLEMPTKEPSDPLLIPIDQPTAESAPAAPDSAKPTTVIPLDEPTAESAPAPSESVEPVTSVPDAAPAPNATTSSVSAKFMYADHLVTSTGVNPTKNMRPIRKARVTLLSPASNGQYYARVERYTDTTGAVVFSGTSVPSNTNIRLMICTVGPDSGQRIKLTTIETSDNSPWCITTSARYHQTTTNLGTINALDTREGSGPWNIFQVAVETWEFLSQTVGTPTQTLPLLWYWNLAPVGSPNTSYYFAGRVNINGTLANGDQWNDSVIAHEIGHWVMEKYAQFPPNYLSQHGLCQEGNPGLQYSEGWANFFSSASRKDARVSSDRTYASWYIDAPDDNADIGTKPTSIIFKENLETSTTFDTTESRDFRKGNFCEWQIAGALWDVLDANADNRDTLQRSFRDIFTAFQTRVNGHFPYTFNEWWYGWTNTLGNRSGSSLGDEQKMLDNFADHKIQVGIRLELVWGTTAPYIDLAIWLPPAAPREIDKWRPGSYTTFPFAGTRPQEVIFSNTGWISSPYKGKYVIAAVDYGSNLLSRFTPTAQVLIFDGSTPGFTLIQAVGTRPDFHPWWYITDIDGETGGITIQNRMAEPSFEPYE